MFTQILDKNITVYDKQYMVCTFRDPSLSLSRSIWVSKDA